MFVDNKKFQLLFYSCTINDAIWKEDDMIKGNESDVADIVVEILAKELRGQILLFYIVFSIDKLLITL